MQDTLTVHINTPGNQEEFKQVKKIYLPGIQGDMTILPNHTALISPLKEGIVEIYQGATKPVSISVEHGLAVIDQDQVEVFMENRYDKS